MRGCAFILCLPLVLIGLLIGVLGNQSEKGDATLFFVLAFFLALVAFGVFAGRAEDAKRQPAPPPEVPEVPEVPVPSEPPSPELLAARREQAQLRKERISFAIGAILLSLGLYGGMVSRNWTHAGMAILLGILFIASALGGSRKK